MKKYLSVILVLSMLLTCFSITPANASYEQPGNFDEMLGLLKALEIIPEDFEISGRALSRAEFTEYIVKTAGYGEFVSKTTFTESFTDITAENPYAPYISLAKGKKLSMGYSDGTFRPDENISLMEVIVYMIRLLGYTDVAEAQNGYPGGYYYVASNIKLLRGLDVSTDTIVTDEIAVNIIFNALNTKVMGQTDFSPDKSSINLVEGPELMYQNFRVSKEAGVVDEVDLTALTGSNDLNPYTISVNGRVISIGKLAPNDFLGYNVNAYYKQNGDENVLIYICENYGKNKLVTIDIDDILTIADYIVTYENSKGDLVKEKYERSTPIIYNGVATKSVFDTSIYLDENKEKLDGTVEILDNDNDGVGEVIFVNAYEEYIVGTVNTSLKTIYDKKDKGHKLEVDITVDDPYTIIFDELGNEINLGKIKENSSVLIAKSKAKPDAYQEYIRIYVSNNTVQGKLSEKSDEDGVKSVKINGEVYELSRYANDYFDSSMIGKNVIARLNVHGKITLVEKADGKNEEWGMLVAMKEPTNVADTAKLRIFTESGEIKNFEVAKKLKIDARSELYQLDKAADRDRVKKIFSDAATTIVSKPSTSSRYNIVIRFKLNEDGKITTIDTILNSKGKVATMADMETDDLLYADAFNGLCVKSGDIFMISAKVILDNLTPLMLYPADVDDDSYAMTTAGNVYSNGGTYSGYAYYVNKDSVIPDLMSYPSRGFGAFHTASSGFMTMVKKITETVDEDGFIVKKLYVYTNNELSIYLSDPELTSSDEKPTKIKDLKPGDIIYLAVNNYSKKIESFQMRYSVDDDAVYNSASVTSTINKNQFAEIVYPYKATDIGMQYVVTNSISTIESLYAAGNYRSAKFSDKVPVTVYDASKRGDNMVVPGSVNDIIPYITSGTDATKIVIHSYNSSYHMPRAIFIIKGGR